ncbi:hypothetical protein [Klebsiella pneumoniae]|uniref:hypothetical protein n=1 Tax=Klebsiella pneumoniae TaxID=573 RepID=UPI000F2B0789|nr:hypothetical protein [Klebsiella pneumoniae]VCZ48995.1 hypothetical protein BANRA_05196 [Klebsiella pneumoniae]
MSWFNDVFGFEESDYAETQARFSGRPFSSYQKPAICFLSFWYSDHAESGRIKESGQQSCDRTVWKVQI